MDKMKSSFVSPNTFENYNTFPGLGSSWLETAKITNIDCYQRQMDIAPRVQITDEVVHI